MTIKLLLKLGAYVTGVCTDAQLIPPIVHSFTNKMVPQHQQQQQQQQHSRSSNSDDDSGCALEEYAWCPAGLKAEQVRQFFKCFPEDKVPFLNSIGEKHRMKLLERQLPPHDSDPKYCRSLSEDEKNELRIFNDQQRHSALGRGIAKQLPLTQSPMPCRGCQKSIDSGSICIYAERAHRTGFWHPQCFTCTQCKEFLVNLIYFHKDGLLYCGRHHAELYKPRCTACDEIIFSDECTEAEGYSWHMDHFGCSNCKKRLGGERYVMRQSQPFCLNCFETMYAEYCDTCGERIETDQAQMAHESQHWHATDACFYCYTCRIPLLNRAFFPRYGALFCSNECALQRNNRFNHSKLIQPQKYDKSPDLIPTTHKHTNQHHVRILPGRSKNFIPYPQQQQQQTNLRSTSSRPKEQAGYISDGATVSKLKRDFNNGYLSDGNGTRRYRNSCQQYPTKSNYDLNKPQVFLQFQPSPESILKNRHQKVYITRSRSREPIQFYNDLNLEQLDRHGATLEIARCSASKTSRASLPDLTSKTSRINANKTNFPVISQETLVDTEQCRKRPKQFDSNEIMYPISRPKSAAYSTTSTQFPRSRSLNGSGRFTKQHHVRFVDDDDDKEKSYKQSPVTAYRSSKTRLASSSSSSSSSDSDDDQDLDSIYRQYDIHGNRIKRPINFGTKISYVDECGGHGKNSCNPSLMKKSEALSKKDQKPNGGRKRKDCIIS